MQSKKFKVRIKKNGAGQGSTTAGRHAAEGGDFPLTEETAPSPKLKQKSKARPPGANGSGGTGSGAGALTGRDSSHPGRGGGGGAGEKALPKIRITFNAKGAPKIAAPKPGVGGADGGDIEASMAAKNARITPFKISPLARQSQSAEAASHEYNPRLAGDAPPSEWQQDRSDYLGSSKKRARPPGGGRRQLRQQTDDEADGVVLSPREQSSNFGYTTGTRNRAPLPSASLVIKPPEPESELTAEESLRKTCVKRVSTPSYTHSAVSWSCGLAG